MVMSEVVLLFFQEMIILILIILEIVIKVLLQLNAYNRKKERNEKSIIMYIRWSRA